MRLVGGNIGDSPVKNVHDGSAFAAAAGDSTPILPTFSGAGTAAQFSNITHVTNNANLGGVYAQFKMQECQWTNNSASIFWLDLADAEKLKHVHLTFAAATGLLSAESAAQDLSADITGIGDSTIRIVRVSATRCVVAYLHAASPRVAKFVTYDISGSTLTKHGAVQSVILADNGACFNGMCMTKLDDDHLAFFSTGTTNETQLIIVKYTTTQNLGVIVKNGTAGAGNITFGRCSYDPVSGKIFHYDGYDMWSEWTWSSTISGSGATATFGAILLDNHTMGGVDRNDQNTLFRHDIEPGRAMKMSSNHTQNAPTMWQFLGRTNGTGTRVGPCMTKYAALTGDSLSNGSYNQMMKLGIDYDEDTFWERRIFASRRSVFSPYLIFHPAVFNWSDLSMSEVVNADVGQLFMGPPGWTSGASNYQHHDPMVFWTGDAQTTIFAVTSDGSHDTSYNTITVTY